MIASARTQFMLLAVATASLAACHSGDAGRRAAGQTAFVSAPPAGMAASGRPPQFGGAVTGAADSATPKPPAGPAAARSVEETDLYRLEGDRLYYLNGYRGLMVFDVSDVDHPALLGRSPIYGSPVDMIVHNGVAIVVVADWYGAMEDGTPFHGSIVRGLDATDASHIKVLGEAKLGGWVADDRVVGDVIYAVSQDYGWAYGWGAASTSTGQPRQSVIVSSVSFAGNVIQAVGSVTFPGFSGVFNVTPNAIMLAHAVDTTPTDGGTTYGGTVDAAAADGGSVQAKNADAGLRGTARNQTELLYLDISDPGGQIVQRGAASRGGPGPGVGRRQRPLEPGLRRRTNCPRRRPARRACTGTVTARPGTSCRSPTFRTPTRPRWPRSW